MHRIHRVRTHLSPTACAGEFDNAGGNNLTITNLFDSFEGKTALVTGGSIGLGRMIAEGLAVNGAKVYICSRKEKACLETAHELNVLCATSGKGGSVIGVGADVSAEAGCIALVDFLKSQGETQLHFLVNNAGATWGAKFDDYPDAAWERVFNLNVRGIFNLTKLLAPLMETAGVAGDPSRVVNIASVGGMVPVREDSDAAAYAYSTSKAAVIHMSRSLAKVLGPRNISTNVIAPGLFMTKMNAHLARNAAVVKTTEDMNPLGRNGNPQDMAGLALFLCSRAGAYVNGAVIPIDGGLTI
jgi:NAD(P)-dependent dehydrogenase (short-subunit alcohol dehydrogenase family)